MRAQLWFAAFAFAAALSQSPPIRAEEALPQWPQATSDLPAEPGIRFGTLPNGMRYAVFHNATPKGQAAIRLRIGAGSLQERDDQQGLAHFLEHMAFKGSAHVPEGEMIRILQRKGLAFGPDTNAQTSYDQTLYMLDLPQADADTLSTGLMLMRETASELKLDAGAFDHERGVILSEERQRDTPQYRGSMGLLRTLLPGQRLIERSPIGKVDVIAHAPVEALQDYYRAHYRPELATLIVVGDIDAKAVEQEIIQRFSDWKGSDTREPRPDLGSIQPSGMRASILEIPGGATKIQLGWTRPFDPAPDNTATRRRDLIEELGLSILNRRLIALSRKADAPFISAQAASQDLYKSARITLLSASTRQDGWQAALAALDQEQRRLVRFGIGQDELDREIAEYRASLQAEAEGAATRTSTAIAQSLASSVNDGEVFTSPSEDLRLFDETVKALSLHDVEQAIHRAFEGSGPAIILQTEKAPKGGVGEVEAAYAGSSAVSVAAPLQAQAVKWPYTDFGTPGEVVERRTVEDLGVTMVRFANGVRLTVKPTKYRDDEIFVRADIGHGRRDLPRDRPVATWTAQAFDIGGLKAISYEDMEKALAGNVVNLDFSVEDGSFRLLGKTRPADFQTQLQLLAAYASEPAYRPEAFARVQQSFLAGLPQYSAAPGYVISRDLPGLLRADDPRWAFPSREQLQAAKPSDFAGLFQPLIASGPIDVTIVGDVSVKDAIRLTAGTFGALPKRAERPVPLDGDHVSFPAATAKPVIRTHTGREDQAAAIVAVPVGDILSDLPRAFAANVTGSIFKNRLVDQFRIAEGATYSPQGSVELSDTFPGFGYAYAYVETTPAKVERFFALAGKIARDMKSSDVTADELARAKEPLIERARRRIQSNEYWLGNLDQAQDDPRRLDLIRMAVSGYEKVSAADVRAIASTYLQADKVWKLEVLPEKDAGAQ